MQAVCIYLQRSTPKYVRMHRGYGAIVGERTVHHNEGGVRFPDVDISRGWLGTTTHSKAERQNAMLRNRVGVRVPFAGVRVLTGARHRKSKRIL